MSDLMLLGILRMPLQDNPADCDPMTWMQAKGIMREAAARIEKDADEITKLRAALSELVGAASRVNMRTGTEFYTAWRAAYDITKEATIEDYSTVRAAAAIRSDGDE